MTSRHEQLRTLFANGFTTVGAYDPFTAKIAENHGYPATYIGSFSFELAGIAAPDMGLMTLTELATLVSRVSAVTTTPILCDVDTGFGGLNNIWRTVQVLEAAGASALQIEDQAFPKVCPILPGKSLVSIEEAAERISVASNARRDPNFMVIARSDADVVSVDELIRRSNRYLESGADAVLPMMLSYEGRPHTEADPAALRSAYIRLVKEIDGPVVALDTVPGMTSDEMLELGISFVLFPTAAIEAAFTAVEQLFASTQQTGRQETYFEQLGIIQDRMALMDAVGVNDFLSRAAGK
ncbi:oxaloacetate decarboxylase [Rhodococcus sp. NCIMB 12038]|uniref:isocitrate lyase/PEP mutase family protein n=1 Tax=Rhodococcus sp. NCIMB 12038 TaxID=933800 RepID=UPI000B3C8025|nr:isocitrate lyase/PEP mutase family protein [Rhodococcus sp. NCIMB 12038]OUS91342.1 hypothetical protein CA951_33335 [Rhodococcus sp. NCIMB 12038]